MLEGKSNEGLEIGIVKYFDKEKKTGFITPDHGGQDVTVFNSPIILNEGDKVKFKTNEKGFITYISLGSDSLFEVLNQHTLDLDKKYLGKEYKEIEEKYGEIINQTLKYETSQILRNARNISQSVSDEKNYEFLAFIMKFIKATLPEAFKNIITITDFNRENIRKIIPDNIYDKFVDNPKIQQIMNDFISEMIIKFPNTLSTYNYSKEGGLVLYAYKEIGSYVWMTLNCYMNNIDPAILESTQEEMDKRAMESLKYFEEHKKRPAIIINNKENLSNILDNIVKHEEDKRDYLNSKN